MAVLQRIERWLSVARPQRRILLLAGLLVFPAVLIGFTTDDHNFRLIFQGGPGAPELARAPWSVFDFFGDRGPEMRQALMDRGVLPWWVGDTFRAAFCRPLSSLSHYLDWRLFGEHAWPMHLHSIALFLVLLACVGTLYRRTLGGGWVGALALLIYALDDSRGMNIGWLSGRNALLTGIFALLTVIAHDRWRRDGWKPGMILAPLAWGVGLGCGEAALAAGGILTAYMLCLDRAAWHKRFFTLLPYAPVFLVWAVLYKFYGYGVRGSDSYVDPLGDPVYYLQRAALFLPVQLFGLLGLPDCVFFNVLPQPWQSVYWLVAAGWVGLLLALVWPILRARPEARFWGLAMVFALLPTAATLPQDRLLTLGAVGGAPLVALLLERLYRAGADMPWGGRFALRILVFAHLLLAPVALMVTNTATGFIEQANLRANASLPLEPGFAEQTLIIANAPSELMELGVPMVRSSLRQPVPAHTLLLSAGNTGISVVYDGPNAVVVKTDGDYLNTPWANLFRNTKAEPLVNGWTRQLAHVRVEVLDAGPNGSPRAARFTFPEPLESAKLCWMTWSGDRYVPFIPPGPGKAMRLAERPFIPLVVPQFEEVPAGS